MVPGWLLTQASLQALVKQGGWGRLPPLRVEESGFYRVPHLAWLKKHLSTVQF